MSYSKIQLADIYQTAAHGACGQKRKFSGLPYSVHPRAVASLIVHHTGFAREDIICAALLHDVVEDTHITLDEIEGVFGSHVGDIVAGMTKDTYPGCTRAVKFSLETARLAKCGYAVKTIKLADSICNMQDYIKDDPKYAYEVYVPEKRILIDEALKDGHNGLWVEADSLITNFMESYNGTK